MHRYFRPELASLAPLDFPSTRGKVRLHLNENPYPLPPPVRRELARAMAQELEFNRYGLPETADLRRAVAAYAGLEPEWVDINSGSDAIILGLHLAFGGPGRQMVTPVPTFPSYQVYGAVAGTEMVPVDLEPDFSLPRIQLLQAAARSEAAILALCNPNNPTGNLFPAAELEELIGEADSLVVVDEAYFEYSGVTVASLLAQYPHLLVMRTFSKAFNAAGIRLGYLLAHPDLIREMRKVRQPFALGLFPQLAGQVLLRHRRLFQAQLWQLQQELEEMREEANCLPGVEALPSCTNFFLLRTPLESEQLARALAARDILVSDVSHHSLLRRCIRVSLGRPEENRALLDALSHLVPPD